MRIGLQILGDLAIVFGTDDSGFPLPPDVGVEGYHRLIAMAGRRGGGGSGGSPPATRLLALVEAGEEDPSAILPEGFVIVEVVEPAQGAGLYAYDGLGDQIAGPVDDIEDIVAASAAQSP